MSKRNMHHTFTFKVHQATNGSLVASVGHGPATKGDYDSNGALYYVIAVILIYGCSILMMIASYVRKNKADGRLNRYLKEMAFVRKRERQLQIYNLTAKAAAKMERDKALQRQLSIYTSNASYFSDMSEDSDMDGSDTTFPRISSRRKFSYYNTESESECSVHIEDAFKSQQLVPYSHTPVKFSHKTVPAATGKRRLSHVKIPRQGVVQSLVRAAILPPSSVFLKASYLQQISETPPPSGKHFSNRKQYFKPPTPNARRLSPLTATACNVKIELPDKSDKSGASGPSSPEENVSATPTPTPTPSGDEDNGIQILSTAV